MILIDKRIEKVLDGYDWIHLTEKDLAQIWRDRLRAAYTRRFNAYIEKRNRYRKRKEISQARQPILILVFSIAAVFGLALFLLELFINQSGELGVVPFCLSILLILIGMFGWVFVGVSWVWRHSSREPFPPPNPFKPGFISPLLPEWRKGLTGPLTTRENYHGWEGEKRFILSLIQLPLNYYLIHQLVQRPRNDVDVVLICPSGVWVFEVKYLKGTLSWRDGRWIQSYSYHAQGGRLVNEEREYDEPFEHQWQRMADEVERTIRLQAPDLVSRMPAVTDVMGGLVFAHPGSDHDMPRGVPFDWGTTTDWTQRLVRAPARAGFDERTALQLVDVLLKRHHQISDEPIIRSMIDYADGVSNLEAQRLKTWVEAI